MGYKSTIKTKISRRDFPIAIEMRPLWRISLIVIAIKIVGGDKLYLDTKKLNILVWMLIRSVNWDDYEEYLHGRALDIPFVSVDAATYKAVEFASAKQFIYIEESRLYITEQGCQLFDLLVNVQVMEAERAFLQKNGKKLTDTKVKEITGKLV
ncbi:hypothetical protein [Billgrantia kenyensis]|uniref:Uncharacterized protein n=1 Tax=Billgrantia kenyensis TaxID=321266 RepID=A0A7V9W4W2_9GAMM|nr:hypothetical protein [Halomonas kenyensis]MBA2781112.1 hypothetical protein [Halomonas kenyensis]MCG6659936.1 hypothetical protein [Halomonas kenyensis]